MGERVCAVCQLPGLEGNRVIDYVHDQGCLIYAPSGTCSCSKPGYWAHEFKCPIPVEGDMRPPAGVPRDAVPAREVNSGIFEKYEQEGVHLKRRRWFFWLNRHGFGFKLWFVEVQCYIGRGD